LEDHCLNLVGCFRVERTATDGEKVLRVRFGLSLQDSVDGADKLDQIIHCVIPLLGGQLPVFTAPFKLIQNRMLRFLYPVG
jgi:hypothetical protein